VASVHTKVEESNPPANRPLFNNPSDDESQQETLGTRKRKREEEEDTNLDAAVMATDSDCSSEDIATTASTPDAVPDSTASGAQTPASSVDSDIIQRIDPLLLMDEAKHGRKAEGTPAKHYFGRSGYTHKQTVHFLQMHDWTSERVLSPSGIKRACRNSTPQVFWAR
jgi:hypothetical protein